MIRPDFTNLRSNLNLPRVLKRKVPLFEIFETLLISNIRKPCRVENLWITVKIPTTILQKSVSLLKIFAVALIMKPNFCEM